METNYYNWQTVPAYHAIIPEAENCLVHEVIQPVYLLSDELEVVNSLCAFLGKV